MGDALSCTRVETGPRTWDLYNPTNKKLKLMVQSSSQSKIPFTSPEIPRKPKFSHHVKRKSLQQNTFIQSTKVTLFLEYLSTYENITLSSYIRLGFQIGIFPVVFPTKIFQTLSTSQVQNSPTVSKT